MRRKLVAGNWKMNGNLASNQALLGEITAALASKTRPKASCDIAVCVPAPYLMQSHQTLTGTTVALGAQDVSAHEGGAFTGEIAASMLGEVGCRYVIVGHSERRAYHGESNTVVAQKTLRALHAGITPIVCVGETLAQREAGETARVVGDQIEAVLAVLESDALQKIVVAYEPVWAIGTGKTATPEMAQVVHAELRARLALKDPQAAQVVPILYGGSMKPENAKELMAMPDIDGGLIGGAALKAADFLSIIEAA